MMKNNNISKNILMSMGAQIISLATSIIINLLVPKFISIVDYANWQTYILYSSYVGILHLGILDGLVLRYSQYDYDQLNKKKMKFVFIFSFMWFYFLAFIGILYALFCLEGYSKFLVIAVSISIITKNSFMYISYLFQLTNRISLYAKLIIYQKAFYVVFIVLLLIFKVENFIYFCIADILADLFGYILMYKYNSEIFKAKSWKFKLGIIEIKTLFYAGVFLMIANFSNNFIVGSVKIMVQVLWSKITFGEISLGFSILNLFLTFVMSISIVLFPSLKRMDENKLSNVYEFIRALLTSLLLIVMIFYFPAGKILEFWLPNYEKSIIYAGILLPIIIFSTKTSLLTNNFLKTFRKEKTMFTINIFSLFFEVLGIIVIIYLYKNINFILYWTVLTIALKAVITEYVITDDIGKNFMWNNIGEIFTSIIFIYSVVNLNILYGMIFYGISIIIYFLLYKKEFGIFKNFLKDNIQKIFNS